MNRRTVLLLLSTLAAFAFGSALVAVLLLVTQSGELVAPSIDETPPAPLVQNEPPENQQVAGLPVESPSPVDATEEERARFNAAEQPIVPAKDVSAGTAWLALKAFETNVNADDCATALEFWPEYNECGKGRRILIERLREKTIGGLAVFHVEIIPMLDRDDAYRGGREEFVTLEKTPRGWRRVASKSAASDSMPGLTFDQYVQKQFGQADIAATEPAKSRAPGAILKPETAAPTSKPDLEIVSIPPEQEIAGVTPDAPTGATPAEEVRRLYNLVAEKSCDKAREIRPDYTFCEAVNSIEFLQVFGYCEAGEIAFVNFQLDYTRNDAPIFFKGRVRLDRKNSRWLILPKAVEIASTQPDSFEAFARSRLEPAQADCHRLKTEPAPPLYDTTAFEVPPGGDYSRIWRDYAPTSFGSAAILNACFSRAELAGRSFEIKPPRKGPRSYLAPPDRARPVAQRSEVLPGFRGSIRRVNTGGRKLIALGFDIGERNNDFAGYDGVIIDYLRKHRVKATLYMGGKWLLTHPERSLQLIADPLFEIGNHAWTHGNFRKLSPRQADEQIYFTEVAYENLRQQIAAMECARNLPGELARIPERSVTFRFPYGTCNDRALEQVNDAGMPAVQWDIVTADPAPRQPARAIANEVLKARPGSIVVMHANGRGWNTARALPMFIPKMRAEGWEFVTVAELLALGEPVITRECFERVPGDNLKYDKLFGIGTGE